MRCGNTLAILFLCIYSIIGVETGFSQTSWNLPDNRKNTRFTSDHFNIPRPALSMRSFDNTKSDTYQHQYSSTTYGVRQVLEKAYGIDQTRDSTVTKPFRKIIGLHDDGFNSFTTANAEYNSAVLESVAFVALMTFIIEENDGNNGEPNVFTTSLKDLFVNMPSHATARNDFISALQGRGDYFRDEPKIDAFKRSRPLMKVSRAWDLYLALENAYEDLGGNLSLLLNQSDKQWWNDTIYSEIKQLWQDSNANVPVVGWAGGVGLHEAQAGNWPLIAFVATGYASLGFNGPFNAINDADETSIYHDLDDIFDRAMKSTAFHYTDSGDKRYNYWWYQTGEGSPFWAEGAYYFEVALPRVLEFWHAVRANDKLNDSPHGDGIDPFRYDKFLEPLTWHADIATSDGDTPPFDDGNKKPIRSSVLLSWSSAYGADSTGKKFAHIRDLPEIGGPGSSRDQRLVEIAIPHQPIGNGTPPPDNYGRLSSSSTEHQQIVIRRTDSQNKTHYLFLNGESGDAISRGEGHEQPDQLQLLYYVDDGSNNEISYLMDTGYDRGAALTNSTWNDFIYHNVLYPTGEALNTPHLNAAKTRKVSDHNNVQSLETKFENSITVLKGNLEIEGLSENGGDYFADYRRKLLLIEDDSGTPFYIINANSHDLDHTTAQGTNFEAVYHLQYFSDTQNLVHNPYEWSSFVFNNDPNLYVWKTPIAYQIENRGFTAENDFELRERNNGGSNYFASRIIDQGKPDLTYSKSTVSFLQLSDSEPNLPERLITYVDNAYHQAYAYKHSNSVIDVFIQRVKVDGRGGTNSEYYSDVIFTVPDANNIQLELPAGKDYGFARLKFGDPYWDIDDNYKINLKSNNFIYANDVVIGSKTYPHNSRIYIDGPKTLTINGDVTLQPNTTVYMDPNAKIEVSSSGSIDADGVTFTTTDGSTDPADHWKHIKLNSGANNFDNCWFIGAEKALYVSNSSGASNLVENSNLHYNEVGVYVNDGNITLAGTQVQLSTNSYGVVVRGTGDLATTSTGSGVSFEPTLIKLNTTGLYAYDYSTVYVKHTKFAQNDYNLKGAGQGQINAGQTSYQHLPFGYNAFDMAGSYDIYNTSTHTVDALYNWWGWAAEPNASRFYGSVDYESALSCDPTTDGTYCDPIDDGGGGCYPYCYSASTAPPPMMSGQPGATSSNSALATPVDQETVKQYISSLYQTIRERSDDPHIYRAARQIYLLLDMYDTDGSLREWAGFDEKLQDWQSLVLNAQHLENPKGGNALAADRLGWAAVFMQIRDELKDQNYGRVHKLAQKWSPLLSNSNDRASLLAAQAVAWERSKEFGKALAAYEAIEQIEQRSAIAGSEGYAPPDYSIVKAELTDSMNARQQSKAMLAHSSTKKDKQFEEPPKTLEVDDPYPNPFNPTTTVPFAVPDQAHVSIEVYNSLG